MLNINIHVSRAWYFENFGEYPPDGTVATSILTPAGNPLVMFIFTDDPEMGEPATKAELDYLNALYNSSAK